MRCLLCCPTFIINLREKNKEEYLFFIYEQVWHKYMSRRTDTQKVEALIQLLSSGMSKKVQNLKCTQSIKVKSIPLKDISTGCFCAKLTEHRILLI